MKKTAIQLPPLRRKDWPLRLSDRFGLGPFSVFMLVFVINLIIDVFLAVYFNAWAATPTRAGFEKEPGGWAIDLILQPLVFSCYIWISNSAEALIKDLFGNNKVQRQDEEADGLLQKFSDQIHSPWFSGISILAGTLTSFGVTYFLINDPTNHTWQKIHPAIYYVRNVVAIPVYITTVMLVLYVCFFLFAFNRLIRITGVNVQLYHSDNAGGFGQIGQFVSNIGYFILGFGICLSLIAYQSYLNSKYFKFVAMVQDTWFVGAVIALSVYVILAVVAFLVPVYTVHLEMVKFKNSLLDRLSMDINRILSTLNSRQDIKSRAYDSELKKLHQLEETREITLKYPVWPFNSDNVKKYISLVSAPILPLISSILVDKLESLLKTKLLS